MFRGPSVFKPSSRTAFPRPQSPVVDNRVPVWDPPLCRKSKRYSTFRHAYLSLHGMNKCQVGRAREVKSSHAINLNLV
jgi:hypothetical protein